MNNEVNLIGESDSMKLLKSKIKKVAATDTSVLIYGETGTGKDMVARMIHGLSGRAANNYISRNCSAIPSNLTESIFFGSSKGSYTGAEDRVGIFEAANGGTVFLDEINSMNIDIQSKILKVIEGKKVIRVGETQFRDLDLRIISAVNRDPRQCIKEKLIRADLYYRLAAVLLYIPPLRERRSDIPLLVDYFIKENNKKMGKKIKGLSPAVRRIFSQYDWPGNVRELKNAIEGAFNFAEHNCIHTEDLPDYLIWETENEYTDAEGVSAVLPDMKLQDYMNQCEKRYIEEKMKGFHSLADLSYFLGISKQTLNYKLKKYEIDSSTISRK